MASVYNFDPTGTSSANRIVNEQHVITAVNFRDYHYVIPKFAPFFQHNFQIRIQFPDQSVRTLIEGQDYYLSNQFLDASRACAKPIYGSISFLDTNLYGIMSISYNTVGGIWNLSPAEITRILAEEMRNPRITTWEQITYLPERFPVVDHEWDLVDMVGASEIVRSIDDVRDAVLQTSGGGLTSHVNNLDNPHNVTKAQVGLGNVLNYGIANAQQAQLGVANNVYMTPLRTAEAIDVLARAIVNTHELRKDNPHEVTKVQVGLGSVQNFGLATDQEAITGAVNNKYMTPHLTRIAMQQNTSGLASHIANTNNPHHVTKEQVGLFNVENYAVATEQEARAGTLNNRYMTPLRTMQLCREFVSVQLDGHATLTNNPHFVDKYQVGLGNVQNFPIATVADMQAGTSNSHYVTPALVAAALQSSTGGANDHFTNTNNPHSVTAEQVGAYSKVEVDVILNNYLTRSGTANDSRLFNNRSDEEYRDWLRDNLAPFNANTLDGMGVGDIIDESRWFAAQRKSFTYESAATGTNTWIKLGWLDGLLHPANDQPATSFIVSGGERFGFGSTTGDPVDPIFVRASLKKTDAQSRPVVEGLYLFSAPSSPQLRIGTVWNASSKRLTFYARVPTNSSSVHTVSISGRELEVSEEMWPDGFGFEESVTEPAGIVYITAEQSVDKARNADKLGGNQPSHYATASSVSTMGQAVSQNTQAISSINQTVSALDQRLSAIEQLLNSINVE